MTRAFHSAPGRESARQHVEYAVVTATLAQRTDLAILLAREDLVSPVWVPKKALDIGSRVAVERAPLRTEIKVSVDLKLAMEKQLV